MIFRHGFVSNSSSCSYVVIDKRDLITPDLSEVGDEYLDSKGRLLVPTRLGETEFGWAGDYYDIYSRINFVLAQIACMWEDGQYNMKYRKLADKWWRTFRFVCEENGLPIAENPDFDLRKQNHDYVYIDHQSSAKEGANTEIFEDDRTLSHFIFGKKSAIHCDNDNK